MSAWRSKQMDVSEWAPLQERFAQIFVAGGADPAMAMFCDHNPGAPLSTVLITAAAASIIEPLSPGGWQDCDPANQEWILLVGHSDAREQMGLRGASIG